MIHPYDVNIALCAVEQACLDLKAQIADGSMLRGHTARPVERINMILATAAVVNLKSKVDHLERAFNATP